MLGDATPLFFPILLLFLAGWLIPSRIESYSKRFSPQIAKVIVISYRFSPLVLVGLMIVNRVKTIINRDTTYLEIAQRLGPGDFQFVDLRLLFTGEGASESILFLLLCFALISHKLPSISISSMEIRKQVQHRIMAYISFSALISFWILFPESSYYSPSSLPLQTTHSSGGDYSPWIVLFTGALVLVSSELFAITTMPLTDEGLKTLTKRSKIKMYFILPILILLMINSIQSSNTWWVNISQDGSFVMVLFFISNSVGLVLISVPSNTIEAYLQHGEGRSISLTFQLILNCVLIFVITSFYLAHSEPFNQGNGYLLQASWLTIAMIVLMIIALILPNFGFDGAARPELWWLRFVLIFAPSMIFMFTPVAIFLLPACWCLLAISIVQPWFIERDVPSPSVMKTLLPLTISIIFALIFSLSTDWPLMAFIVIGWIPGLLISEVMERFIGQMKVQESA